MPLDGTVLLLPDHSNPEPVHVGTVLRTPHSRDRGRARLRQGAGHDQVT